MVKNIDIQNFRLLKSVELSLEQRTTVIVGRNNSGKTSLTEIFRRLLSDKSPNFSLFDFDLASIENFKAAFQLFKDKKPPQDIRNKLPFIQISISIEYDKGSTDLGIISDFIVDLNPGCNDILVIIRYELQEGKTGLLFGDIDEKASVGETLSILKERIPQYFETRVFAQDPNDSSNSISMDYSKFRQLLGAGFINAQRGLDDITHTEKDVLGKVLAKLFKSASNSAAPADMKEKSAELQTVVKEIQKKVDTDFNVKLNSLLPALQIFGYPGLSDPKLSTETTLDIGNILDTHTKIRYAQGDGFFLPESYNGLGSRNLIYILFQLFEFFRDWQSKPVNNSLCLVFIEEPEAHLHPQMQQVFIKQLDQIAKEFAKSLNGGVAWPVQFIVTTHSTHIANEASFDAIRYFLTSRNEQKETKVKDLRKEFSASGLKADKDFLHKYLTLTKCDLYFADKAILVEGPAERLLMPILIDHADNLDPDKLDLSKQYVTTFEVGGAYAHHFYKFLDFLELRTLVITDLDSVKQEKSGKTTTYKSCEVAEGSHSSNAAIKNWYGKTSTGYVELKELFAKKEADKLTGSRRIAFQIPEKGKKSCPRSFEDAFIMANLKLFKLDCKAENIAATEAFKLAPENNAKTEFALKYALEETNWIPPLYILEGLHWLAKNPNLPSDEVQDAILNIIEE